MERLQKIMAHAGVGSRRHCEELIRGGRVSVDGRIVKEMGVQLEPGQHKIAVDGQLIHAEKHVYWLVYKPRGVVCTNYDPARRPRAIDLVPHVPQRVYTVGRLDADSEGLLLLTNDGELAHQLMHPRFGVEKTYLAQVAGSPTREDMQKLLGGVFLSEGRVRARRVKRLKAHGGSTWLRIVLAEGKNREIRRMLARLEHKVLRLKRIAIGPVVGGALKSGKSRRLTRQELAALQEAAQQRQAGVAPPPDADDVDDDDAAIVEIDGEADE